MPHTPHRPRRRSAASAGIIARLGLGIRALGGLFGGGSCRSGHLPDPISLRHTGGALQSRCARCGSPLTLRVGGWLRDNIPGQRRLH